MPRDVPPADSLPPASAAFRPPWVGRYDMRFADGDMPQAFDGVEQAHSVSRQWVRDEPPRPLDHAALASICDGFFPRIYIRRRAPSPIGTVSISSYFHADAALLAAQQGRHVLGVAWASNFRNGYFDQSAQVWSAEGELLAVSHQMVYYRA